MTAQRRGEVCMTQVDCKRSPDGRHRVQRRIYPEPLGEVWECPFCFANAGVIFDAEVQRLREALADG